jgi:cytochrome c oxidase subunit 1
MHITGLEGEPRHYAQLTGIPHQAGHLLAAAIPLQAPITFAAIFLAAAQLPFLLNLVLSLSKGKAAPPNPWQATTFEWAPEPSPDEEIAAYRAPCSYREGNNEATFLPQWVSDSSTE